MKRSSGEVAEMLVAEELERRGYEIRDRNWQRPQCEIDIVAEKDNTLYFYEVKYRRTAESGSGFEAITNRKIRQMQFAAGMYCQEYDWHTDYRLSAAAVSGPLDDPRIEILESIEF